MPSSLIPHPSSLPDASYRAPWWLPGGHAQTLYAYLCARRPVVSYRRTRWETPDGDFIELDWVVEPSAGASRFDLTRRARRDEDLVLQNSSEKQAPLVALFHGLEGSSRSHYALALMSAVRDAGWRGVVIHFRGCGGEANRLPRAYHSGDSAEIDWIVQRLREESATLFAAGVSLGGNALLKWLGETGASAGTIVKRAVAVSAPVNLMAAGNALGQGLNLLYARHFLATLNPKALEKLSQHPGLFDAARVRSARTLREFDDVVTGPLHGFTGVDDYWTRASSKPWLMRIAVPTLMINARNDPFLPESALPAVTEISPAVVLDFPAAGGHAGFVTGRFPGHLEWLPRRILRFFGNGQD